MKKILILLLIIGDTLQAECTEPQKALLDKFEKAAVNLGLADTEDRYRNAAQKLKKHAENLSAVFPNKHLFEIKKECYGKSNGEFFEMQDNIPYLILKNNTLFKEDDDNAIEAAKNLIEKLLDVGLFAPTNLKNALLMCDQLLVKKFPYSIDHILKKYYRQENENDVKGLLFMLEKLLLGYPGYGEGYGAQKSILINHLSSDWLSDAIEAVVSINPDIVKKQDENGKTILHRLFERQFMFSGSGDFETDKTMLEVLDLPKIPGVKDQKIYRFLPKAVKPAQFIINFAK